MVFYLISHVMDHTVYNILVYNSHHRSHNVWFAIYHITYDIDIHNLSHKSHNILLILIICVLVHTTKDYFL